MTDYQPTIDATWKNFVTDFGAVADGVTNSSPAVDAWITYAIAHDGSKLYLPPGSYILSGTNAFGSGVNNMTLSGVGASVSRVFIGKPGVLRWDTTHSARFQSSSAGAASLTLVTGAEIARFSVGQWVLVSGLSMQTSGYPPNFHYNEYRQITGIVGATVSFAAPLTFAYLSTWPEADPGAGGTGYDMGGPATLYAMNSDFAGSQTWYGLHSTQSDQVSTTGGESLRIFGMSFDGIGPSPSMAKSFVIENTQIGSANEVDKGLEFLHYKNITAIGAGHIAVQSSSTTQLTISNSTFKTLNGTAQNTTIQDSTISDEVVVGPTGYGHGIGLTVLNSSIAKTRYAPRGAIQVSRVTFSGGTFSTTIANRDALIEAAIPGQKFFFAFYNGAVFNHADGSGLVISFTVTAIRQDATRVYVDTDLGATLPTPTFNGGNAANYYLAYAAATVTQTNSGPADLTQWAAPPDKLTGDLMARDFIKIDTSTTTATQANLLKNYVQQLRQAYETGKRVIAVMGHSNDGTVFTDIETIFGLPAGKGQTVFNLVNGSIGSMEGTFQVADAKTITEQMG